MQILFILYNSKVAPFSYQTIVVNRPNHSEIGNIAKVIIHISFALSPCLIYLTSKNIILRESYKTFLSTWKPSIFILCVNGFEYLVHDYSLDLLWRLMIPLFSRIQYFLNVKIVSEVLHRYICILNQTWRLQTKDNYSFEYMAKWNPILSYSLYHIRIL